MVDFRKAFTKENLVRVSEARTRPLSQRLLEDSGLARSGPLPVLSFSSQDATNTLRILAKSGDTARKKKAVLGLLDEFLGQDESVLSASGAEKEVALLEKAVNSVFIGDLAFPALTEAERGWLSRGDQAGIEKISARFLRTLAPVFDPKLQKRVFVVDLRAIDGVLPIESVRELVVTDGKTGEIARKDPGRDMARILSTLFSFWDKESDPRGYLLTLRELRSMLEEIFGREVISSLIQQEPLTYATILKEGVRQYEFAMSQRETYGPEFLDKQRATVNRLLTAGFKEDADRKAKMLQIVERELKEMPAEERRKQATRDVGAEEIAQAVWEVVSGQTS